MNLSLDDLLKASREDKPAVCPLTGQAAIDALHAGLASYLTEHRFVAGDLITQKDGFASTQKTGSRGDNPAIFVRYEVDLGKRYQRPELGIQYSHAAWDCILGWLTPTGGMAVHPAYSGDFEPWVGPVEAVAS